MATISTDKAPQRVVVVRKAVGKVGGGFLQKHCYLITCRTHMLITTEQALPMLQVFPQIPPLTREWTYPCTTDLPQSLNN